ncbi:MAG TPA: HAD-IIA family hydrolase [Acidimicrobiia bacterium]
MAERTVVCDLDGVVYVGDQAIPGSRDALMRIGRSARVVFCTNNSFRRREDVADKIRAVVGYPAAEDQVFTSAMAAARLAVGSSGVLVVGGPGVVEALGLRSIPVVEDRHGCDAVVVGLDLHLTYEKLSEATLAVRAGARLIATNHDATFPTPEGLKPGGGAIAAAIETATGVKAQVAGKPHSAMHELLAEEIGEGEVWMVGDRADTDLAMARAAGWLGALVRTGVPREGRDAPDLDVADLAAFADALDQRR